MSSPLMPRSTTFRLNHAAARYTPCESVEFPAASPLALSATANPFGPPTLGRSITLPSLQRAACQYPPDPPVTVAPPAICPCALTRRGSANPPESVGSLVVVRKRYKNP